MNLIIDNFDDKYVHFFPSVKNTVMDNSSFIRIGYSDALVKLNGIYVELTLKPKSVEKYFNKSKYFYDFHENEEELTKIIKLEEKILSKLSYDRYMNKAHKLKEQLFSNNIRVFCNNEDNQIITNKILVKISGIWETENSCGLTFKFFNITHP
tara:strand:+ start:59 stop:517 length:459 start_codon:yes stop_codon:yes gene_type:complete